MGYILQKYNNISNINKKYNNKKERQLGKINPKKKKHKNILNF